MGGGGGGTDGGRRRGEAGAEEHGGVDVQRSATVGGGEERAGDGGEKRTGGGERLGWRSAAGLQRRPTYMGEEFPRRGGSSCGSRPLVDAERGGIHKFADAGRAMPNGMPMPNGMENGFWVEMEAVLQLGDAKDWVYKGEGAANLILSYTGSSPSMLGKVLRVKKILRDKAQPAPNSVVFSSYEQLLWGEIPELVESVKQDCLAQAYAVHVMSQHLGANHVDGGVHVRVSKDFLEIVGKNVLSARPAWRVNASAIDTSSDSALLISDHSLFSGKPRGTSCIAVEIKAKCGFLPSSEYISKENSVKKQVTRYKMHQQLKFHQGEISKTSEYDPLDLFSGSKERICMAIKSLFSTPQNNFRIFVNGSLVFGGMGGGADRVHRNETKKCLEDLSKASGLQLADFIELLTEAIFKSGVLGKQLTTQKLDDHDIEGAIHLYYNIISQPCLVCKNITDAELLRKYAVLHSLSLDKSQKIVRDFLISATAKDCSLMMSFRPRECETTDSEYDSVFLESVNRIYDYKAYFVDLDVKPLDKMVHYFNLDQKIVNFYTKNGEVGRIPCDSPKGGGSTDDTKVRLQH